MDQLFLFSLEFYIHFICWLITLTNTNFMCVFYIVNRRCYFYGVHTILCTQILQVLNRLRWFKESVDLASNFFSSTLRHKIWILISKTNLKCLKCLTKRSYRHPRHHLFLLKTAAVLKEICYCLYFSRVKRSEN